jgi:hypothetical protein
MQPSDQAVGQFAPPEMKIDEGYVRSVLGEQALGLGRTRSRAVLAMSDDRPASVADIVVEELRKKEINGLIQLPKRDFFTRGR